MIIVCIKTGNEDLSKLQLTVGKHYKVLSTRASYSDWDLVEDDQYVILNDHGINYPYCMSRFVSLEEWRDKQIEKVINV